MGKLDGKIAVITGGSTGIGFATAQRFIEEGAEHVFITGRRQDMLDEAVNKLGNKNITAVQGDTSNLADLDNLYKTISQKGYYLDIIFANAGCAEFETIGSITETHFDNIFNVHVKGVLFTVQKLLPIVKNCASIILNASIASIKVLPGFSVYSAAKAAVRSFARTWTVDLKERKIRVNALSPGPIDTPGFQSPDKTEEGQKRFFAAVAAGAPLQRIGTSDEIAKVVVFLASDDSSYITGIELFVDGGTAQV